VARDFYTPRMLGERMRVDPDEQDARHRSVRQSNKVALVVYPAGVDHGDVDVCD
jgi:hypothetical protein